MTLSKSSSLEQDVLVFPELVAFDQIAALDLLLGLGVLRDHADAVAGLRIDQVEADRRPVVARVVEGDGAGDEREAQMAAPDRSQRHQAAQSLAVSASILSSTTALARAAIWSSRMLSSSVSASCMRGAAAV